MVGDRIVESMDRYALMPILLGGGTEPWGVDRSGRVLGTEGFAYQPGVPPDSQTEADSVRILLSGSSVLGSSAQIEAGTATPEATPLRPAPGGMLLIVRTPTLEAPGNRYDLIDRTGELRGVIRLPADQSIVGFGSSSLYVVRKDEMDLQTLSRHPWPLSPS